MYPLDKAVPFSAGWSAPEWDEEVWQDRLSRSPSPNQNTKKAGGGAGLSFLGSAAPEEQGHGDTLGATPGANGVG